MGMHILSKWCNISRNRLRLSVFFCLSQISLPCGDHEKVLWSALRQWQSDLSDKHDKAAHPSSYLFLPCVCAQRNVNVHRRRGEHTQAYLMTYALSRWKVLPKGFFHRSTHGHTHTTARLLPRHKIMGCHLATRVSLGPGSCAGHRSLTDNNGHLYSVSLDLGCVAHLSLSVCWILLRL